MEDQNLLSGNRVRQRIQKCLREKEFKIESFRVASMGILMSLNMADVTFYNEFRESIRFGQLPWYSIDIFIMCIGLLEATMTVVWSWYGRHKLRTILISTIMICVSSSSLWALPAVPVITGKEFCSSTPANPVTYMGISTPGAVRMAIFVYAASSHAITRSAIWNHSHVLIEQLDPGKLPIHYGTLLTARFVSLLLFPRVVNDLAAPWMLWLGIFVPGLLHTFQFWRIPPLPLKPKDEELECAEESEGNILPSWVVVGQIFAAGLLVSALWGYMWHLDDIVKVAFFVLEPSLLVTQTTDVIYYIAILLAVGVVGLKSTKRAPKFKRLSGMKLATVMTMIVTPLYSVQTMLLTCDPGNVAGLYFLNNYTQPVCSAQCGCAVPFSEFDPVCITDTMTTYLTPCHAGCDDRETIGGITVYRNCSCAPDASVLRALPGACSAVQCRSELILHKAVSIIIVVCTLLALQGQTVSLMKSVRARHRAALIGAVTSVALFLTFPCGHLVYAGIRATTCVWFEGGRCMLPGPVFLQALGGVATGSAGLAALLTCVTWIVVLRKDARSTKENIDLTSRTSTLQRS